MLILVAILFSSNVSCMFGEIVAAGIAMCYKEMKEAAEKQTGCFEPPPPPPKQPEDNKNGVQRPGEHVSPDKPAEKDVELGTDKGAGATSEGAPYPGGEAIP